MKRIMTLFAAVAVSLSVMAQNSDYDNYIGLTLHPAAGVNTMVCSPADGTHRLGIGIEAGLHYNHFFGQHFGFGFGAHYDRANSSTLYNHTEVTAGLTHTDNPNVTYDLKTDFNNWKEHQGVNLLSVPVELFYRNIMSDKWSFLAGLGASFDIPFGGKYRADDGSYTTSGYFPALGYNVYNLPSHGFGTTDADMKADINGLKLGVSVIADLGFRLALKNNWGLYFGVYCGYSLNNMAEESDKPLVQIADDATHTYNGTFASTQIDGLHLLRAGVKLGIDLGWIGGKRKAEALAAEQAAREKAEAERLALEKAEAEARAASERAAREKAEAERLAREKAEAEARAAAERAARAKAEADARAREQALLDSIAALIKNIPAKPVTRVEMQKQLDDINATVYFETSGTTPKFDAKTDAIIHTLCASMMVDNNLKAEITGHTDNTGTPAINMKYGTKRAEALKKYMVSLGAPAANIIIKSRGQEEPIVPNDSDENRAKNRRATVVLK
ncbi:MAG: OmpA family protein [Bacteroidales bacterium]|nr:OmpA family protein [Bacteroidales bacterium]